VPYSVKQSPLGRAAAGDEQCLKSVDLLGKGRTFPSGQ
jgi:hypothetical protein